MSQRFRETGVQRIIQDGRLEFVIITHEHMDHYFGIESILKLDPKITIIIPETFTDQGYRYL